MQSKRYAKVISLLSFVVVLAATASARGQSWCQGETAATALADEDAYGKHLDVSLKKAKTYWEKRICRVEGQTALRDARANGVIARANACQEVADAVDEYDEFKRVRFARKAAQRRDRNRISLAREFDWPVAFACEELVECRARLEEMREACLAGSPERYRELAAAVRDAHRGVRGRIKTLNSAEYFAAKQFLEGIANEAESQLGAGDSKLAAN